MMDLLALYICLSDLEVLYPFLTQLAIDSLDAA